MITLKEWYEFGHSNMYVKRALANWGDRTLLAEVWEKCQDPRVLTSLLESGDHELEVTVSEFQHNLLKDPLRMSPGSVGLLFALSKYTPDDRAKLISFIKKGYVMRPFYPAMTCNSLREHIRNPFV